MPEPMPAPAPQTPSQTVGPFFHYGLVFGGENILTTGNSRGPRLRLRGRVLDGDGAALPDALVEIWQADAAGRHLHPDDPQSTGADPAFRYFGRSDTVNGRQFEFLTLRPGRVAGPAGGPAQAPHLNVHLFARGLLVHLHTRIYFADEAGANAEDPVLAGVTPSRRHTLIARRAATEDGIVVYTHDLVLQGANETVFFSP
jgi:protocatechuate 3,4-dioxygenase alpha subunit